MNGNGTLLQDALRPWIGGSGAGDGAEIDLFPDALFSLSAADLQVALVGRQCPPGRYCPEGTSVPELCQIGTYLPTYRNDEIGDCHPCDSGMYCGTQGLGAPEGECFGGFFCYRGNSDPAPRSGLFNVTVGPGLGNGTYIVGGDRCPAGFTCGNGTILPDPCAPGTYQPQLGQSDGACITCPAGFYCEDATVDFANFTCPQGHYCEDGTTQPFEFPCPAGTYSNQTGLQSAAQCLPCDAGQFCAGVANIQPDGPCDEGYFCTGGAQESTPTDGVTGDRCVAGEFCPAGSDFPIPCNPGQYCLDSTGAPAGDCDAGFYCTRGSFTPRPAGQNSSFGVIGDICPPGRYCPNGTFDPFLCPNGTFSAAVGNEGVGDCQDCTPGFYCPNLGQTAATLPCTAGFYCPAGTTVPTLQCFERHECPEGTSFPRLCAPATFQDDVGQSSCELCRPGYYCINGTEFDCPPGAYCPGGYNTLATNESQI